MGIVPILGYAHEVRPAYLEIKQQDVETYNMFWKVPRLDEAVLKIQPQFSGNFELQQQGLPTSIPGAMLFHYQLKGDSTLAGQKLHIDNLNKTMIDVLVTITYLNGEKVTLMMQPDKNDVVLPGETSRSQVIKTYTILGIEHIWFGIDHLLFVLALIIITVGFKKIVKTITAFTIAHSITLSLAVLGYVHFPTPPVEAVIALSIVFLALEMIRKSEGKQTLTSQKPWIVAFTFGMLHGFGFAGALADVGLPQIDIPMALAFFNVGVELGQIAFVVVVLAILKLIYLKKEWPTLLRKIPAYAIGSLASFWMIERIAAFWMY